MGFKSGARDVNWCLFILKAPPFYCYDCHKALQLIACSRHERICWCNRSTSSEGLCFDLGYCNMRVYHNS